MSINPNRGPVVDDDANLARPFVSAGVPTTAFNGVAPKGALCIDKTNAILYINTGTLASNTWTKVGLQT